MHHASQFSTSCLRRLRVTAILITLFSLLNSNTSRASPRIQASSSGPSAGHPKLVVQLGHSGSINAAALSRDGRLVLSGGDDLAILWETATGRQLRRFVGHTDSVTSVAFSLPIVALS